MNTKELNNALEDTLNAFIAEMRKQYSIQGHILTGKLANSMRYEIEQDVTKLVGKIFMEEYGLDLNNGVRSKAIPFGNNQASRDYRSGLMRFWMLRGLSFAGAKRAAYFTHKKHKEEGMPTKASSRFSKNGRRIGALDDAIKLKRVDTFKALEKHVAITTRLSITNEFKKIKTKR
jgi:hypothetical protein